ncbi:hypothetical protein B0H11DRAFT_1988065 [Mycena galericulata]|nr:hypothetical protein B0H11DRAFT_1988065 [Mycena galericulata]
MKRIDSILRPSFLVLLLSAIASLPGVAATVGQSTLLIPEDASDACGVSIQDSDFSAAISSSVFDGGAACGDDITVEFEGKSVVLKVVDECPLCIASSIEMTQAAYTALEASVLRPITVTWEFD